MKTGQKILVVEDEPDIRKLVNYNLAQERFRVIEAKDGEQGLKMVQREKPDLVILDLMLPGLSGMELCKILRERHETEKLPVLMLTAKAGEADRIVGLEMGADDCMDRPLLVSELAARIRAVLRRTGVASAAHGNRVRFDGWELQRSERHLRSPEGVPVALSNTEFQLLSTFLQAPRRVVSRDDLAARAQGQAPTATSRSIDLLVSWLRHKLDAPADRAPLIRSVRGVGYRFDAQSIEALA